MSYITTLFALLSLLSVTHSPITYANTKIIIQVMSPDEYQPKVLRDSQGKVHQIYYKILDTLSGNGHLYYRQYNDKHANWSNAVQVSTQPYPLPGVLSPAKFTIDDDGRVHATWLRHNPNAYMYTRSNIQGTRFEVERSLVSKHLDGFEVSSDLAVKGKEVTLTWMVGANENARTVYTMTSLNGGQRFNEEKKLGDQRLGGCSCCGFTSRFNKMGKLIVAYRSAAHGDERHMQLLTGSDKKDSSDTQLIHRWNYSACPVSTNHIAQSKEGDDWLTFETAGRIYIANLQKFPISPILVSEPKQDIRQKYPEMSINDLGYKLVVWREGNGYARHGISGMQLFSPDGSIDDINTITKKQLPTKINDISVTSLADNSFLVVYQPYKDL